MDDTTRTQPSNVVEMPSPPSEVVIGKIAWGYFAPRLAMIDKHLKEMETMKALVLEQMGLDGEWVIDSKQKKFKRVKGENNGDQTV